ncbi:hypothetical protein GO755_36040 [Spirosoma sp. HMF4905]|uniref:Phage tail tape measure protein n=1 Tax=Spirosoma arboris TaxID=2682092 RepID=A0A7K1SNW7_9BACT|nr:hypothetical protein [Spirosoma arboris]MVM35489.1 hypothetical protein [Spirosoma arboris]
MAKRVERQELIDLDGLRQALTETRNDYVSFVGEITKLNRQMQDSILANVNALEMMRKGNASTDDGKKQEEYAKAAKATTDQIRDQRQAVAALSQFNQQLEEVTGGLLARQKQLLDQYAAISGTTAKDVAQKKRLASEIVNLQNQFDKLDKSTRSSVGAAKELSGQYNKLQKELADSRNQLKGLENAFTGTTLEINKNNSSAVALAAKIKVLDAALKKMDADMGNYARTVGNYRSVLEGLATGGITGAISGLSAQTALWGTAFLAVGTAAVSFGKDVLDITAKFEKYNAILAASLGSTEAGAVAFKLIQDFAVKTNFSVDELTDSYIKLANRGLRPGTASLTAIADVANTTGKTFDELVEAINDINNSERWTNIGIKAKTVGDKVQLTFRGVTKTVERTEAGVLGAVEAFGKLPGVVGMTATISGTLDGQLSNLGDNFDKLKTTIGGDLKDGFRNLISLASWLIDVFISIWKGTASIREGFSLMAEAVIDAGKVVWDLIKTLLTTDERLGGTFALLKALAWGVGVAFKLVSSVVITAVGQVQFLAAAFNVLINKVRELANAFGARFTIDPTATLASLDKIQADIARRLRNVWTDDPAKPATAGPTVDTTVKPTKDADAAAKAAEKARKEQLALDKAQFEERKAILAAQYEDGLISEREYLKRKLALTKEEITEEMKLIVGTGKEQQAERIKLNRQRIDAEREYKRNLLKVNLDTSVNSTAGRLTKLDQDKEDGLVSEVDYIGKRRTLTIEGIRDRQQLLAAAGKAESEEYKKLNTEILNAERDYSKARNKLQEESFKKALDATKEAIATDENTIKSGLQKRLTDLETAYDQARSAIELSVAKGQLSQMQGDNLLHDLRMKNIKDVQRAVADAVESEKQRIAARIADLKSQGKTELQIAETLKLEKDALGKAEQEQVEANAKREKDLSEEVARKKIADANKVKEAKQQMESLIWQNASAAVNGYFEVSSAFRQQDLDDLQKKHDAELAAAGDNASQKAAIDEQYNQKARAIKRKQAQADRAQAAFNIGLSTAEAIMKTYAQFGPLGTPLAVAQGILGALQLAVVLSKPLPEFWRGSDDVPESGPAWVGERGFELIETRKGGKPHYRLAAEKQIMYLNQHDRVYTHQESKQLLQANTELAQEVRSAPGGSQYMPPVINAGISEGAMRRVMEETLGNQVIEQTVLSDGELKKYIIEKQKRIDWKNSYFSLPRSKRRG